MAITEPPDRPVRYSPMHGVESAAIDAIGYDAEARTLQVRFVSGGDYRYFDVPAAVAAAFEAAESKGRFFRAHLLDRFTFERLA